MAEIRPRIVGTEMEWPIASSQSTLADMQQHHGASSICSDDYLDSRLRRVYPEGMMSNGSRFYTDIGDRIEYATPEDTSLKGAVVNELAGERIMNQSLAYYALQQCDVRYMQLYKRVLSEDGESLGYHINLSSEKRAIGKCDDDTMHILGLHLASNQALLGAGALVKQPNGEYRYSYGQKIHSVKRDYGQGTTGSAKPLINQRNESHATDTDLARVHITSTDAHISPWASWMNLGTSSLVLRAIEQGKAGELRYVPSHYYADQPVTGSVAALARLAHRCADDITQTDRFEMADGRSMSAMNIQEALLDIVADTDHTDEEAEVLAEWQQAVADMQRNPMLLVNRSDAIAKLALLRQRAKKLGFAPGDYNHPELLVVDRAYGTLSTLDMTTSDGTVDATAAYHSSYANRQVRAKLTTAWQPDEAAVERAITEPPQTTRAYRRGKAIAGGTVSYASWMNYTDDYSRVAIYDPYDDKFLRQRAASSDS